MATTVAVIGAVAGAAKSVSDHKKLKAQQKYLQQERMISAVKEAKQEEAYEAERTNLLKSKVAAKKALLASRGLDYTGGSAAAMIGNLEREASQDITNSRVMKGLDWQLGEANYNYKKNKNLLDMANNGFSLMEHFSSSAKSIGGKSGGIL